MPRRVEAQADTLGLWTPGYRDRWNGSSGWCTELTRTQKGLYTQITEQPGITRAGVISVGADVLAEQHPDTTPEEIEADLAVLISKNYIVQDGSVLWVRSWFKYARNIANPKYLAPILDAIRAISKARLRNTVARSLIETLAAMQQDGKKFSPDLIAMVVAFGDQMGLSTLALTGANRPVRSSSARK